MNAGAYVVSGNKWVRYRTVQFLYFALAEMLARNAQMPDDLWDNVEGALLGRMRDKVSSLLIIVTEIWISMRKESRTSIELAHIPAITRRCLMTR